MHFARFKLPLHIWVWAAFIDAVSSVAKWPLPFFICRISFFFSFFFPSTQISAPLFSVCMAATKEAGSGAQVPPQFPSGRVSVSAPPTGDWSGGLSVN